MDFEHRLYDLRKRAGLSQEELANLVGVTRQAVQKWEAGTSRPDMDNLAALAQYFHVTLDWLITGREGEAVPVQKHEVVVEKHYYYNSWQYEYKSKRTLFGLPLVHIKLAGRGLCVAKGIIAIGNVSVGLLSIGGFSLGLLSVGAMSMGALVLAGMGLGLVALGALAVGGVAVGGVAIGWLAVGATSFGVYASGGAVFGSQAAVGVAAISDVLAIGQDAQAPSVLSLDAPRELMVQAMDQARVPGWIQRILLLGHGR